MIFFLIPIIYLSLLLGLEPFPLYSATYRFFHYYFLEIIPDINIYRSGDELLRKI